MVDLMGDHPRKIAGMLAVLLAGLVLSLGIGLQLRNMQLMAKDDLERSSRSILAIRQEVLKTLDTLNRDVAPDCNESTLKRLRSMLVTTRYVADIALLNRQREWTCTATAGLFEWPVLSGVADSLLSRSEVGGFVDHSSTGHDIRTYFDRPIAGLESSTHTTLVESGQFAVAIYPHVISDLAQGYVNVVRHAYGDGDAHVVALKEGLSAPWLVHLGDRRYLGALGFDYDPMLHALVMVNEVPGTRYLVQGVVPVEDFLERFGGPLSVWLLVALGVATLAYANLVPRMERLRSLEYRIPAILKPANIVCMYQPIVDLNSGLAVGCEVLMRLRHHGKIMPPDQVIPAVQQRGLTWGMDAMVVEVATAELAKHLPHAKDFKVAFNFFPSSVSSGKVVELLDRARAAHPMDGIRFDVEVLEQAYSDAIIHAVAELRQKGYLISVDDFGTGYSNLGSVKTLAPDILKIDRSFVHDMEASTVRASLIPEVIGIARAVGAKLVAEGIENAQQRDMLQQLGVDFGQGYFFARPMEIDAFVRYLGQQQSPGAAIAVA